MNLFFFVVAAALVEAAGVARQKDETVQMNDTSGRDSTMTNKDDSQ